MLLSVPQTAVAKTLILTSSKPTCGSGLLFVRVNPSCLRSSLIRHFINLLRGSCVVLGSNNVFAGICLTPSPSVIQRETVAHMRLSEQAKTLACADLSQSISQLLIGAKQRYGAVHILKGSVKELK